MTNFVFDLRLLTTVSVDAPTLKEAIKEVEDTLKWAACNAGVWSDGRPVLFEVTIDGDLDLVEVDGEPQ